MPIAWHPLQWQDWCMPEDDKYRQKRCGSNSQFFKIISYAEFRNFLIKMFKFCQKEVTVKDFYWQRQITNTFKIDVNKVVLSDKVSCNNGKDYRYIVDYQVDGALIPLSFKMPKNILSHVVSQYDKNSAYTMSFNLSQANPSQLFEKLSTEPIKGRYVHGKLKT